MRDYEEHRLRAEENVAEMKVKSVEGEIEKRLGISQNKESSSQPRQNSSSKEMDAESLVKKSNAGEKMTGQKPLQDPNRPPPKKAKLMRVERKKKKLLAQGKSPEEIDTMFKSNKQNVVKSVEDLFNEIHGGVKKLEVRLSLVVLIRQFYTLPFWLLNLLC